MYIFLLVLGGGQDKPAWTACPPGVKITRVGGKISRDSLPPGGQGNRGWLAPRGATCPGGKINWDTGTTIFAQISMSLRAISGIVHAHHSCGGKRGKLSGSRLSTIFKFASIQFSDTLTSAGYFRIFWTK